MIEDREMAALFEVECEEHLQTLDDGLLRLEDRPFEASTLEEVFRAAHTIKGSARMLGALDVEAVAHCFEDILGVARQDPATLPPALDRLGSSVEAMRQLVREAVSGTPSGVEPYAVIAHLNGETEESQAQAPGQPQANGAASSFALSPLASLETTSFSPERWSPARQETSPENPLLPLDPETRLLDERAFAAFIAGMAVQLDEDYSSPLHAPLAEQNSVDTPDVDDPSSATKPFPKRDASSDISQITPASDTVSLRPFSGSALAETSPLAQVPSPVAPNSPVPNGAPAVRATLGLSASAPTSEFVPVSTSPALTSAPTSKIETSTVVMRRDEVPTAEVTPSPAVKGMVTTEAGARARAETMRVDPARLDALMSLAGELSVTSTRLARGLAELDDLAMLLDEWGRDARRTAGADNDGSVSRIERVSRAVSRMRRVAEEDGGRLRAVADEMSEGIRRTRLMPMTTIFNPYGRMVRDLAREEGREVRLIVEGGETAADKRALEELKDPLMHIVRNSIAHGLESPVEREARDKPRMGTLNLRARRTASEVIVEVEDDGRGLDAEAIERAALQKGIVTPNELAVMTREEIEGLIFAPGFSTRSVVNDVAGRGVGLDAAKTNIERLKGSICVESRPGRGCTFRIRLPVALTTTRVLLARIGEHPYAVPVDWVDTLRLVSPREIFRVRGRDAFRLGTRTVPLASLAELLELPTASEASLPRACIVLSNGEERLGVLVDALLDEQEVVLKPLGGILERVRNVAGATILGTGEVCMVLSAPDLLKTARRRASQQWSRNHASGQHFNATELGVGSPLSRSRPEDGRSSLDADSGAGLSRFDPSGPVTPRKTVLLVEDSIITRTQEKRILESAGYEVAVAVDGEDAWQKLSGRAFDAVVSDVEMPNLDGLSLAARIRKEARYIEMPIILVTSLATDADRQRGLDVGANAYIAKGAFDQTALLDALKRLA